MANVAPFLKALYANASLRTNCSGFFKAVVKTLDPETRLGVPDAQADAIINVIAGQWTLIGQGPDAGPQAAQFAGQGYLVVALLKAADHCPFRLNKITNKYDIPHPYSHGHLAIVLAGPTKEGYPFVISGSISPDGLSDGTKTVRNVWRGVDAPNVRYYRTSKTFPLLIAASAGK